MVAEKQKEYLFTDLATYESYKIKENKLFTIVDNLKTLAEKSLGKNEIDVKRLLESPSDYLTSQYWVLYANLPQHLELQKNNVFESQTTVRIQTLLDLEDAFNEAFNGLGIYAPTITKQGLKSNLQQSQFDKYLHPAKADRYHTLKQFVESANKLKEYESTHGIHLLRFSSSLRFEGLDIKINYFDFC